MHFLKYLLFILILSVACKKADPVNVSVANGTNDNRGLDIQVRHTYNTWGGWQDSVLPNVALALYTSEFDRDYYERPERTAVTSIISVTSFNHLRADYYYLSATHPTLGEVLVEVSTPNNSRAFLDINFQ